MGLAPIMVGEIFQILYALNEQDLTIFLVEQNARQTLEIAHKGYVMENGQIVLSGTARELLHNPKVVDAIWVDSSGASELNGHNARLRLKLTLRSDQSFAFMLCFSLFNFSHFLHFTVGFSFKLLFEIPILSPFGRVRHDSVTGMNSASPSTLIYFPIEEVS